MRAYTVVYDSLIPDQERYYASLAASHLDIPIEFLAADNYRPFERWSGVAQSLPEPDNDPTRAIRIDQCAQISAHSRVALYCEGPDNLLHYEWQPYVAALIRGRQAGRLLLDLSAYITAHKENTVQWTVYEPVEAQKDSGLDVDPLTRFGSTPEFAARTGLRERWERLDGSADIAPSRCGPKPAPRCSSPTGVTCSRATMQASTGFPIETRFPFMDLRIVRYLLAVPAIPWCANKHVERQAMRGILPEPVRRRPKTPLAGDPVSEQLKRRPEFWRMQPPLAVDVVRFIDAAVLQPASGRAPAHLGNWLNFRPFALSTWFNITSTFANPRRETR